MHKAERAKERRAQEDMLEGLDDKSNLDVVRALLGGDSTQSAKPQKKMTFKERRAAAKAAEDEAALNDEQEGGEEFSYDRVVRQCREKRLRQGLPELPQPPCLHRQVREIAQEARAAKPSDRLKTDAEGNVRLMSQPAVHAC